MNWCLLRLLPLRIGSNVQGEEPAWELLITLKDVVAEHRHRFSSVFPQEKLIPKHNFLEHYPQFIKAFYELNC